MRSGIILSMSLAASLCPAASTAPRTMQREVGSWRNSAEAEWRPLELIDRAVIDGPTDAFWESFVDERPPASGEDRQVVVLSSASERFEYDEIRFRAGELKSGTLQRLGFSTWILPKDVFESGRAGPKLEVRHAGPSSKDLTIAAVGVLPESVVLGRHGQFILNLVNLRSHLILFNERLRALEDHRRYPNATERRQFAVLDFLTSPAILDLRPAGLDVPQLIQLARRTSRSAVARDLRSALSIYLHEPMPAQTLRDLGRRINLKITGSLPQHTLRATALPEETEADVRARARGLRGTPFLDVALYVQKILHGFASAATPHHGLARPEDILMFARGELEFRRGNREPLLNGEPNSPMLYAYAFLFLGAHDEDTDSPRKQEWLRMVEASVVAAALYGVYYQPPATTIGDRHLAYSVDSGPVVGARTLGGYAQEVIRHVKAQTGGRRGLEDELRAIIYCSVGLNPRAHYPPK